MPFAFTATQLEMYHVLKIVKGLDVTSIFQKRYLLHLSKRLVKCQTRVFMKFVVTHCFICEGFHIKDYPRP